MSETGIIRFVVNNLPTVPRADECLVENKRRVSRPVPIQLTDLISAFLILGIGMGLATLIFLLEKIVSIWRRCERRQ
jgi:ionotropic glutamate receptor